MFGICWILLTTVECHRLHGAYEKSQEHSHATIAFLSTLILGVCLVIIWLNQRKASINFKRCQTALRICQTINEHKEKHTLVYVSGESQCDQLLVDDVTGVAVSDSLLLIRLVEVRERRQWKNTNLAVDVWCNEHQSDNHNDQANWILQPMIFEAQRARLDNYGLTSQQIQLCRKRESVPVKMNHAESLCRWINRKNYTCHIRDDYIYVTRSDHLDNLGCMRIRYECCPVGPMSVVASVSNSGRLVPFEISKYISQMDGQQEVKDMVPRLLRGFVQQKVIRTEDINIVVETHQKKQTLIQQHFHQRLWPICAIRLLGYTLLFILVYVILAHIVYHRNDTSFVNHHNLSDSFGKRFVAAGLFSVPFFLIFTAIPWITYYKPVGCCLFIVGFLLIVVNSLMVTFGSLKQYQFVAHYSIHRHFYTH